ncbi:DUF6086 family protein [Streptomyces sp. NBC_00525]|uniref:DUF6086 family protein n=1 Tax=Streptomyces sp. NBC_00525 TaxID=2903660 RepID=UPI002E80C7C9|nr:DUF6086 family protein [Streptomyces sp. NBC_00525]WUC97497.1 DUF6086 family protein [Streptomyces sp. NBC_00525]
MSQYYGIGDRTLWNPSNGASHLFRSQLPIYEAEVGLPSGIGPMADDECRIDPVAFAAFVDALLAWHSRTRHAVMATLSEGFLTTVLALAEIANIEVSWYAAERAESHYIRLTSDPQAREWTAALRQRSHELVRHMAY